jgi:hypothetical protein
MALDWPDKDPDEVLDYSINWTERLAGDVIDSSLWLVPATIIEDSNSFTDSSTTIWLSGGTLDDRVVLTNRITTVGGRVYDQSVRLRIREK